MIMRCCHELSPSEQLKNANADNAIMVLTHFIQGKIKANSDVSYDMLTWYYGDRKLALRNLCGITSNQSKLLEEDIQNIESILKNKWDAELLEAQKLIGGLPHYGDKEK